MLLTELRAMWTDPRPPRPAGRPWADVVVFVVLLIVAVLEGIYREELSRRVLAIVLCVVPMSSLLWRRERSFAAFLFGFGSFQIVDITAYLADAGFKSLDTGAFVLLLVYSLFRWGSGPQMGGGLLVMAGALFIGALQGDFKGAAEAMGGSIVLCFPAVLGTAIRFRARAAARDLEQAKTRERENLARELHDTVAHHVSAIAIQAQAGRAVAKARPEAAVDALAVIEEAASRTLTELRSIVGALRDDDGAELTPQPDLAAIEQLVKTTSERHPVVLELQGDLDDLRPSVTAALYRLVQESLTNALRHARGPSHISITIDGLDDEVHLTVIDDGEPAASPSNAPPGFGLVGMKERAMLLGGTFTAGPREVGGWKVEATIPRAPGSSGGRS